MGAACLLSSSFITWGRMRARNAALILMKNNHFDRTLRYSVCQKSTYTSLILITSSKDPEPLAQPKKPSNSYHLKKAWKIQMKSWENLLDFLHFRLFCIFFLEISTAMQIRSKLGGECCCRFLLFFETPTTKEFAYGCNQPMFQWHDWLWVQYREKQNTDFQPPKEDGKFACWFLHLYQEVT